MRNVVLFLLAFLTVAFVMVAMDRWDTNVDYQAYSKPRPTFEEMK